MPTSSTLIARYCLEQYGRFKGRVKTHLIKNGQVVHTIRAGQKQPRRDQQSITLNGVRYALQWVGNERQQKNFTATV